jgi:CAAX protease family protein
LLSYGTRRRPTRNIQGMNAPAIAQPQATPPKLIAPLWHTGLLLAILAGLAAWSARQHGLPASGQSRAVSYVVTIAYEWLLFGLAAWGIRMRSVSISAVIGERWSTPKLFLRDLGIGVLFLLVSNAILAGLSAVLRPGPNANIGRMLPHGRVEIALWVVLSLSAGICEEFVTRGYLQKQLSGLLKNTTAGLVAQGIIFGAAHAYQGPKLMFTIAVLGCMMGWLAQWRQSVRPGMISHFLQDALGGIILGRR